MQPLRKWPSQKQKRPEQQPQEEQPRQRSIRGSSSHKRREAATEFTKGAAVAQQLLRPLGIMISGRSCHRSVAAMGAAPYSRLATAAAAAGAVAFRTVILEEQCTIVTNYNSTQTKRIGYLLPLPSNAHISTPFFQKTVLFSKICFGKPCSKFLEVCLNSEYMW